MPNTFTRLLVLFFYTEELPWVDALQRKFDNLTSFQIMFNFTVKLLTDGFWKRFASFVCDFTIGTN